MASSTNFTLRQLEYLVAVADHLSFRRAAAACHVSQPALSAQIAEVERVLGVTLFERDRRGVLVTRAGSDVVERARRVLREAADLALASHRMRDPLAGEIAIGVIPTVAPYLLPDAAPRITAALPRLRVLWREERTASLLEGLASGRLDAGLLAAEDVGEGLASAIVAEDPFVLAVPRTHALAKGRGRVKLAALAGERVLLLDDGHCFRRQALAACATTEIAELSYRATSLPTLVQMAAAGAGITLLPELAVEVENRNDALVVRRFEGPVPRRTLVLAWRSTSPAAEACRRLVPLIARS